MKHTSLVSVIIPVYNAERYVGEAIASVLGQTYRPIEVIVINDGSTDGSEAAVKQFGGAIRYYAQRNRGLGATRNQGVEFAQGHFVAFLDADDLWVPDKLERQMKHFDDHPHLDMVFGYIQQFYTPELENDLKGKIAYTEEIMKGHSACTLLIKHASFYRAGPFDTEWNVGEFIDWYLKAKEMNLRSDMLPEVVARRRLHDSNMGTRERTHQTDYVRILKASLDRRRQTTPPC